MARCDRSHMRRRARLCAALMALCMPLVATAQKAEIEPDGTVIVPPFRLPPSAYSSDAARAALPRQPNDPEAGMMRALSAGKAGELRLRQPELMAKRLEHLHTLYPVVTTRTTIAGVPAVVTRPTLPIPARNRRKLLLNLPGGGFVMAAAGGVGQLESAPLAVLAGIEIVSITYRQAPEARFPAATEDVVAVYRALLKDHRPEDIGIFGCSAGGLLTAEAIAAFEQAGLPLPAAIGIFCASADARPIGDSRAFARPFQALPPATGGRLYFEGTDLVDPRVSPVVSPDLLRRFPPTLLISATRAMEMSAAVNTHRALVKAGVEAELHLWDGLGHAFFYDTDLPESREAFDVMRRFFVHHLKLAGSPAARRSDAQ